MNINQIQIGQTVYHPKTSRRVVIIWIDEQSEYVKVQDIYGNTTVTHVSNLELVTGNKDMSISDAIDREG